MHENIVVDFQAMNHLEMHDFRQKLKAWSLQLKHTPLDISQRRLFNHLLAQYKRHTQHIQYTQRLQGGFSWLFSWFSKSCGKGEKEDCFCMAKKMIKDYEKMENLEGKVRRDDVDDPKYWLTRNQFTSGVEFLFQQFLPKEISEESYIHAADVMNKLLQEDKKSEYSDPVFCNVIKYIYKFFKLRRELNDPGVSDLRRLDIKKALRKLNEQNLYTFNAYNDLPNEYLPIIQTPEIDEDDLIE